MATAKTQTLERLDALEAKITQASQTIAELSSRCKILSRDKERLEKKLTDLTNRNKDLAQQIIDLQAAEAQSGKVMEEKEILRRIDRMIEKFGELQV